MSTRESEEMGGRLESWMNYLLLGIFASIPISISVAEPLVMLCVLLWAISLGRASVRRRLIRDPYFIPVILFAVLAFVASAWGPRPVVSLARCHRLLLLPLIFVVSSLFGYERESRFRIEYLGWALVCGAGALALYDMIRVPVEVWKGRELFDTGNMRDPQMYMSALCLLLGMTMRGRLVSRRRLFGGAGSVLTALGMIIHFKRGVWLSFTGAVTGMSAMSRKWRVLAIIALCGVSLLAVPKVRERIALVRGEWQLEQGGRYALWTCAAPALLKQYPGGMGLRATTHEDLLGYAPYIQPRLNHLHNNILQIGVEIGWAGVTVWIAWMVVAIVIFLKTARRLHADNDPMDGLALGALGAFFGLLLNGVVEYNFGDSEILMLMCALMGLSSALWTRARRCS